MAKQWTREEEILAFVLYCETPFGKIHVRNPDVIRLAELLDRSPASVSMKMCNFARFDPTLKKRGVSGLANGSKLDEQVWDEFHSDWERLINEREYILSGFSSKQGSIPAGREIPRMINARVNQNFFRRVLLSAYGNTCCITGIHIPELLIASHIKPWKDADPKTERTTPTNGLLLNAFHDRAFDKGLITVDTGYKVRVSMRISATELNPFEKSLLFDLDGAKIRLPEKFAPEKRFLEYHNDVVFLK